ncbi:hypothetical protein [Streptomyces sp. ISL-100]|uniref:hypothetical protein n=1 Tax=Streptomyces sp. ISL-100 TaxID=2819173 RepID=UPI001BE9D628|nr:hypothetical protein [Streptomyces sp. ISL-100]MBT2398694.1 hypothetical protein [Streptomyces sp. ISL-100]
MLGHQFPKIRAMLLEAKEGLTAFAHPPTPTPSNASPHVLIEMHDEWIAFPRRYLPEGSMDRIYFRTKIRSTRLHHHGGT